MLVAVGDFLWLSVFVVGFKLKVIVVSSNLLDHLLLKG